MRLALTIAYELREHRAIGELSSALVAEWVERFGQDTVDMAVAVARAFLLRPDALAKEFAERLQRAAVDPSETQSSPQPQTPPLSPPAADIGLMNQPSAAEEKGRG